MDLLDQLIAEAGAQVKRGKHPRKAPVDDRGLRESEYIPFRLVALVNRTHCLRCNSKTEEFGGLFEDRRHTRLGESHWVRLPVIPFESLQLPRVKQYREHSVAYCGACVGLETYKEP